MDLQISATEQPHSGHSTSTFCIRIGHKAQHESSQPPIVPIQMNQYGFRFNGFWTEHISQQSNL